MRIERDKKWIKGMGFVVVFLWALTATAQTYNSGSTGLDGALAPTADTTLALPPSGIFNFTTVNIPVGVTVTFTPNANNTPVTLLATGDVTISGGINVNGARGLDLSSAVIVNAGATGGPGGYPGGQGGAKGITNNAPSGGQGPGAGFGISPSIPSGTYGAPTSFVTLIPLFGGSGGGGGAGNSSAAGPSGGGGGGAIVIVSSTQIAINGSITAHGGAGGAGSCPFFGGQIEAGGGSGGAIRLVSAQVSGTGTLQALGGGESCFGGGGSGLIRLEAFNLAFTGSTNPVASTSITPGPVTAASTPSLINLPTLTISSVGGVASSANPSGSYTSADISLSATAVNPIPVNLTATNTPVGTVFTVRLIPQFAAATNVASTPSIGTFSTATATANVSFPVGQVSLLNAFASFTLPAQIASLYPLIDGEPVERIMLATHYGGPSTVTLITKSGKKATVDQLMGKK